MADARTARSGARTRPARVLIVALAAVTLAGAELLHRLGGLGEAAAIGRAAWILCAMLAAPLFGLREWAMGAAAGLLAAALAFAAPDGVAGLVAALDLAAFFSAFILLMMLLREAAATSRAIREVGYFMTHQPAGRRYVATAVGAHLMGVLLNFGAISLFAPLVQQGVRADPVETEADRRRLEIRERRQLTAMIRGFSWMIVWAPTTLTQAIVAAALPGLDHVRMMTLGLLASASILLLGWAEDRWRWRAVMRRAAKVEGAPPPWRALGELGTVCLCLIGASYALMVAVGAGATQALMLVAPGVLVGWVFTQNLGRGPQAAAVAVGRRLDEIALGPLPTIARDAVLLGAAGFIGAAAARLAPGPELAAWIAPGAVDPWLFLSALPVVILLAAQVALSPITTVVFLGGVLSNLSEPPAAPELVGLALGAGWALSMTGAPNATGSIILSSMTGVPGPTLTWGWSGVFTLLSLTALSAFFFIATRLS